MKLNNYNKIISANWKMNGSLSLIDDFVRYFSKYYDKINSNIAIIICPPAAYLYKLNEAIKNYTNIFIGAQDCSNKKNSSRTGDISASILKDIGCDYVILGHSERRDFYNENNNLILEKINCALEQNLKIILCIGENESQKNNLKTFEIIEYQIENSLSSSCSPLNTIIAYEPVWAIGSGITPKVDEIENINNFIQKKLKLKFKNNFNDNFKIIYGGSVNPNNSKNLLFSKKIDGVLIGGCSLIVKDFSKIINFDKY